MRARPSTDIPRLCVLGLCALGAGCAGPVARAPQWAEAGNQGRAWEVVMPGALTGEEMAYGPELSRRDDALSYRDESGLSDDDRPSLNNAAYLYIPHRTDTLLYFPAGGPGANRWGTYGRGVYRRRW